MHDFPGITAIGLDQERQGMASAALADGVGEDALGAVVHKVHALVAGQGLGEAAVVGGHVTVAVAADGINDLLVTLQHGFLQGREGLISEFVETGVIFRTIVQFIPSIAQERNGSGRNTGSAAARIANYIEDELCGRRSEVLLYPW